MTDLWTLPVMHVAFSWEMPPGNANRNAVEDIIQKTLQSVAWVRALSNFYIVKVSSETERVRLKDALSEAAKTHLFYFVLSPIMNGRYDGYLPETYWPIINERTVP